VRHAHLHKGLLTVRGQGPQDRPHGTQRAKPLGQPGATGLGLLDIAPAEVNLQLLLVHGLTLSSGRAAAPAAPVPAGGGPATRSAADSHAAPGRAALAWRGESPHRPRAGDRAARPRESPAPASRARPPGCRPRAAPWWDAPP